MCLFQEHREVETYLSLIRVAFGHLTDAHRKEFLEDVWTLSFEYLGLLRSIESFSPANTAWVDLGHGVNASQKNASSTGNSESDPDKMSRNAWSQTLSSILQSVDQCQLDIYLQELTMNMVRTVNCQFTLQFDLFSILF